MRLPRDVSGEELAVLFRRYGYDVTRQTWSVRVGAHYRALGVEKAEGLGMETGGVWQRYPYCARVDAMDTVRQLTAVIAREGDGFVATCPELDVVSQGNTVEEARLNLVEAVEGFLEVASPSEIQRRWKTETYITSIMPTMPSSQAVKAAG